MFRDILYWEPTSDPNLNGLLGIGIGVVLLELWGHR